MAAEATSSIAIRECPRCSFAASSAISECPRCGVVIDKAMRLASEAPEAATEPEPGQSFELARFTAADGLVVEQRVERLEALLGVETANQYTVMDTMGNVLFVAAEASGNWGQFLGRVFLKASRPFTIDLMDPQGTPMLEIERPFRFYFHEIEVKNSRGQTLGSVVRRFSFFNKRYQVKDVAGREVFEIHGPMFRPWTFRILRDNLECGVIKKRWSGLGREVFTDADKFGIELPKSIDTGLKSVLLGAVFLIDFVHFEDNAGNN